MGRDSGVWKYCSDEQVRDMLLSFRLLGDRDWADEKILTCLFALSNHPEKHYHQVKIPKRSGGYRTLDVPDRLLAEVQRNILHHVLEGFSPSPAATAYKKGSSVVSNAAMHVGKRLVLKLDIHDFFRNITFPMVLCSAFPGQYFPASVGTMLTSLCCLREHLPQGAPTSPAVSNLVMRPFDRHMTEWCRERGINYSRYSDDMTFSGDFDVAAVVRKVGSFLQAYGLDLNREKTKLCSGGSRQSITGIVVNHKPQLPRDYRRRLRQEIYYCRTYGVEEHLARRESARQELGRQEPTRQNLFRHDLTRWEEDHGRWRDSIEKGSVGNDSTGIDGIEKGSGERERQAEHYLQSLLGKVSYLLSVNPEDSWFAEARRFLKEELKRVSEGTEGQNTQQDRTRSKEYRTQSTEKLR